MYDEGSSSFLFRLKTQFGCCGDSCDPSARAGKVYFQSFEFLVVFADFERKVVESREQARSMRMDEENAFTKFRRIISIRSGYIEGFNELTVFKPI